MKLTGKSWLHAAIRVALCVLIMWLAELPGAPAHAQAVTTTTVQGTVYLANGQPGAGTLTLSWPAFTTAAGQLIAADKMTIAIPSDGFVTANLAPNEGATPAGQYYTATFYMSDGTVSTQYWTVPAAAQASLAQVQAQVMPATEAVQTVTKTYVDQSIATALSSQLTASGGNLTGPLYLNADPTEPMQAADKRYVDSTFSAALPLSGGAATGPITATQLGAPYVIAGTSVQSPAFQSCADGSSAASCISAAKQNRVILPVNATGSFSQYPYQQATAFCSVDLTTGQLTIIPSQLGYGYTSAPTVTWTTDTTYTGSLGTIVPTLGGVNGEQVTGYTVSGANSGWGPANQYYHGQCPIKIAVANPPTPPAPVAVVNQANGVFAHSQSVHPEDFGCKGDGSTDDTLCFNYAAQYAAVHGDTLKLRAGATYYFGSVTGYYHGGFDTGEAPIAATLAITVSGGAMTGCSVSNGGEYLINTPITNPGGGSGGAITATLDTTNHVVTGCTASGGSGYSASFNAYAGPTCSGLPCTTLAPEPVPEIGYSVALPSNLTIDGNGATILGAFTGSAVTASSYSTDFPYVAAFGVASDNGANDRGNYVTIHDLTIKYAFIGIGNPGAQLHLTDINFLKNAIDVQILNSQYDTFKNVSLSGFGGVIAGGEWMTRSPIDASFMTGFPTAQQEMDGLVMYDTIYTMTNFPTLAEWITARKAIDCWYDKNFFHLEDQGLSNSDACYSPPGGVTRITDQDQSQMWEPDGLWRGVMGIAVALYTRYGWPTYGQQFWGLIDKFGSNYAIVSSSNRIFARNVDLESSQCNGGTSNQAAFGSASCPNPYEPYNSTVPGSVLLGGGTGASSGSFMDIGGTGAGTVVRPAFDTAEYTQIGSRSRVLTPMTNAPINNSNMGKNPVNWEGSRIFGDGAALAYQFNTTREIPSDGSLFLSTDRMYVAAAGGAMRDSQWLFGAAAASAPTTMPPTFQFKNDGENGHDLPGQVILPGLKVNGGQGVQGGQVKSFTITNAGTGYTPYSFVSCSVAASPLDIPGTTTTYQSDCGAWAGGSGTITYVWCSRCGQGYTSAPAVSISAPSSGTTATATASIAPIDTDNPITHLTTCSFYLNAGGTIAAGGIETLSDISCDGAQYAGNAALDGATVTNWPQTGGFPSGLQVRAWVTAADTISVQLTNFSAASISYPAGTNSFPWVVTLQNSADSTWGINNPQVTPTVNTSTFAPYSQSTGGGGSSVVASVPLTTYTGTTSTPWATLYTPSVAGTYRECGFIVVNTAGTAGTYFLETSVNPGVHPILPHLTASVSAATQYANTGGSSECFTFPAAAGQPIQWILYAASVTGTPSIQYMVTLERLQ